MSIRNADGTGLNLVSAQTNFGDFISPFPNYFNLGPDVEYLVSNGVRGIFQEGAYTGSGGEMCELKDYLLGRMMFDPSRNASE